MPISRKKACSRCRESKARCSLGLPRCTRCASRSLDCDYSAYAPRASPYPWNASGVGPAAESAALAGTMPFLTPAPDGPAEEPLESLAVMPGAGGSDSTGILAPAPDPTLSDNDNPLLDLGSCFLLTPALYSDGTFAMAQSSLTPPVGCESNVSKPLAKRRPLTAQAFFATKIMLGQIESYPSMMIKGLALPPFIHSRCSLGDGLDQTCSSKGRHQCLPRTLSICASLVQLFYSKTPESSAFVWATIYAEQNRLYQEHENMACEDLLEALQATCIYIILQTLDPDSMERNDVRAMVDTLGAIGERLHDVFGQYTEDYKTPTGRDMRYQWMVMESTRRTVCLLYIIETLLEVLIGKRDRLECGGFSGSPLPCGTALWETASTAEWARSHQQLTSSKRLDRPLMLEDVQSCYASAGTGAAARDGSGDVVADVLSWCGSLDQFGTIVWMAATLAKATV